MKALRQIKCGTCSTKVSRETVVCAKCGASVAEHCTKCPTGIAPYDQKCPGCGTVFSNRMDRTALPPRPQEFEGPHGKYHMNIRFVLAASTLSLALGACSSASQSPAQTDATNAATQSTQVAGAEASARSAWATSSAPIMQDAVTQLHSVSEGTSAGSGGDTATASSDFSSAVAGLSSDVQQMAALTPPTDLQSVQDAIEAALRTCGMAAYEADVAVIGSDTSGMQTAANKMHTCDQQIIAATAHVKALMGQ